MRASKAKKGACFDVREYIFDVDYLIELLCQLRSILQSVWIHGTSACRFSSSLKIHKEMFPSSSSAPSNFGVCFSQYWLFETNPYSTFLRSCIV